MNELLGKSVKQIKRIAIIVAGFTVLLVGIAMIFLPGPAIIVIPLGLALLATEFIWARRLLNRIRENVRTAMHMPVSDKKPPEKKDS